MCNPIGEIFSILSSYSLFICRTIVFYFDNKNARSRKGKFMSKSRDKFVKGQGARSAPKDCKNDVMSSLIFPKILPSTVGESSRQSP